MALSMRRIFSVIAVAALMVAMLAASAMPAFALPGGIANDDKNNPTFPSTGSGKKIVNPDTAENISEVCTKNPQAAQCF